MLVFNSTLCPTPQSCPADSSNRTRLDDILLLTLKGCAMSAIIGGALFGNALVIVSVFRFERLRSVLTNYFIVSLAFADFLVALLVMPFNALLILTGGHWSFGLVMCNVFNSNDVLFSTASIVHLCCISMDRYIAVLNPLQYEVKMTRRRVVGMLAGCWLASLLISYIPIHAGIYTTRDNLLKLRRNPELCHFLVNPYYAVISSAVSFWTPCLVMIIVYCRIFVEARKQEKKMYKMQKMVVGYTSTPQLRRADKENGKVDDYSSDQSASSRPLSGAGCASKEGKNKIRREHKAAKTLGIIMGCFFICWLPFFLWYTATHICGHERCPHPEILVDILFWIGYCNSTLNPLIYAVYNREFRNAFGKLLRCPRGQLSSRETTTSLRDN